MIKKQLQEKSLMKGKIGDKAQINVEKKVEVSNEMNVTEIENDVVESDKKRPRNGNNEEGAML
jgi:hypothetical protein